MREVVATLISKSGSLAARVAEPNFDSNAWSEGTIALARDIEGLSGLVSVMSPPACAQVAYANLRASTIELGRGTGLIVSGVADRNRSLLASGAERLAAGRGGLPVAQANLAAVSC